MLAVGNDHACVLLDDGAVHCWGRNNRGQLGLGDIDTVGVDDTPAAVGPVSVLAPDDDSGSTIEWVGAGDAVSCAILSTGGVRCWGDTSSFDHDMLPYEYVVAGEGPDIPLHPTDARMAAVGAFASNLSTCITFDSQRLRCWGTNTFGVLGYGIDTAMELPAQTPEAGVPVLTPEELDAGVSIVQFERDDNNFLVLLSTGEVRSWGSDAVGETGHPEDDGTSVRGVDAMPTSATIEVLAAEESDTVVGIAAGTANACVVTDMGRVRCWGAVRQGVVPMEYSEVDSATYHYGDEEGEVISAAPGFDPFAGVADEGP